MVSLNSKRWIFSLALCVGVAAVVWGRAGGGDGYGGGVSGDGGGGAFGGGGESFGGSGLDTDLWVILFQLVIRYPLVGISLLVVFYFVVVRGHSFIQDRRMLSTIVRGIQRQNKDRLSQVFDQFRGRDPGFDPVKLQDRIRMAFLKSQEAWSQQNLEPVRPFVSDGMFEQWHIQFLAHQRRGLKNIVSDLRVTGVDIVGAEQTPLFDVVHAKINAVGVDQWVSQKTGEVVDGKENPVPFCEYWTFLRRPGVRSLANGGLIEGQCPNCGAGLKLNDKANCSACGSLVASAEYDWTLVKITQEEEWRFREHKREVPGVAAYLASDPGFNVSFMEDRVSAVFWRVPTSPLGRKCRPVAQSGPCLILRDTFPFTRRGWLWLCGGGGHGNYVGAVRRSPRSSDSLDKMGRGSLELWTEPGWGIFGQDILFPRFFRLFANAVFRLPLQGVCCPFIVLVVGRRKGQATMPFVLTAGFPWEGGTMTGFWKACPPWPWRILAGRKGKHPAGSTPMFWIPSDCCRA
jgi:hypothetical protein